jgi:hypothetical protein
LVDKRERLKEIVFTVTVIGIVIAAVAFAGMYQKGAEKPGGMGDGETEFWVAYPASHPSAGAPVSHSSWVLDALEGGAVMILSHSELCIPCKNMVKYCENVYDDHDGDIAYFDLLHGTDEPRASGTLSTYDPDGEPNYVPMTVVLTKTKASDGSVEIAWHSWEGEVSENVLD